MNVSRLALPGVLLIEPRVFEDERGHFFESFNGRRWTQATGLETEFVQDNHASSKENVLRGLHYQIQHPQGKLVRCVAGTVFDVCVDIRRSSPCFGRWVGHELSAENRRMIWIPEGFAHGYLTVTPNAEVLYKTTDFWASEHERCIVWNDPEVAISWPLRAAPVLSAKDLRGDLLRDAEVFP